MYICPVFSSTKMSNRIKLSDKQHHLIEKLGVMHERSGLQPAPSRVLSLLLVSPQNELSFDQIRETLNLSKSAASNSLNILLTTEKIDYITKPGDRKRYFRNKVAFWKDDIEKHFMALQKTADVLEEILEQRPGNTVDFNKNLADVIDFIRFVTRELPELYRKWEQSKS